MAIYRSTKIFAFVLVLNFAGFLQADIIPQLPKKEQPPEAVLPVSGPSNGPIVLPPYPNKAFRVGESLKFIIKYEFVGAGTASMTVSSGPMINNRPTLFLESKANSNKFIDNFFKVRDLNSSTIDRESLASLGFHQNLKEGNYHVIRNTVLDYANGCFQFEKIRKGKSSHETGPIDQPLQDILSSFFYTRTLPLELGKDYAITVFSDGEVYSLKVKVFPKLQEIKVPAGRFECIRIEPTLVGDAIFKAKEGKMTIWLTNDEHRMPVLLRSKVFIGAFDAELMEYSLGN